MRPPHPQIAIVAIDETSLRAIGRWPWPRTLLADLVERLSGAGAAAVALDILLNEPENSGEQQAVQAIAVRLAARGLDPACGASWSAWRARPIATRGWRPRSGTAAA